jgi:CrcB protein
MVLFYLAVGGVVGTWARYGLGGWIHGVMGSTFPWGTLGVNLVGSFVLGLVIRLAELSPLSPEVRGLLTIGFCGAFTTFSTFTYETVALLQAREWTRAALYAFGSLGLGLVAVAAGLFLVTTVFRPGD